MGREKRREPTPTRPREWLALLTTSAANLSFLVLDELHTDRGRQGADVAMLIRRLRFRSLRDGMHWHQRHLAAGGRRQRKGPRRRPCGCASLVRTPASARPPIPGCLPSGPFGDLTPGYEGCLRAFAFAASSWSDMSWRSSPAHHRCRRGRLQPSSHRLQLVFNVGGISPAPGGHRRRAYGAIGMNTSFKRAAFSGASTSFESVGRSSADTIASRALAHGLRAHRVACRDPQVEGDGVRAEAAAVFGTCSSSTTHRGKPDDRCGRSGPGSPIRPDGAASPPGAAPALTTLPSI